MKVLRTAVFVLFAWFLVAASPAASAEVKIGYANLQKALNECKAGVKAKDDLKVEAQGLEEELNKKQEELKKMKDELDKKASVWNKETKDAKEKEFKTRTADFQKKFMEYGDNLNKKKQETEARIIKELRDVVEEIAKKKGITFVFEKSVGGLLYAPKELDLTDEVIKTYDARKKK
jgi:outer membrane protein